jgi:hypothetical protein
MKTGANSHGATFMLLICVAIGLLYVGMQGHITLPASQRSAPVITASTSDVVVGGPSLSATFIDKQLCAYSSSDNPHVSPACGTGNDLYSLGAQAGIDPAFALAFFLHESTFGRYGIAADNKGLGNIRCTPGYWCKHGFRAYHTWQEGYADWFSLIKDLYVNAWNCRTVEQIIPHYAPSSENDTQGYINSVLGSVATWRQEATA